MGPIKISVIIPTLNAAGEIVELLRRLAAQRQKIDEVLVIDSRSTDETALAARRHGARVKVIERDSFDHGGTRNLAAASTNGDLLVFMTQDALPAGPDTIGNLVRPLAEKDVVISYGRQIPKEGASLAEIFLRLHNYPPESSVRTLEDAGRMGIRAFQSSNVCAAYRRREFELLKGFPEPVVCNEDMLFAAKALLAGYKVAYCAEALVYHSHNYKLLDHFRRYFDIAASLEHEQNIIKLGKTAAKGMDYFVAYLKYAVKQKKLLFFPGIILETGIKYLGFKAGQNHKFIPHPWKVHFGLNATFWTRQSPTYAQLPSKG